MTNVYHVDNAELIASYYRVDNAELIASYTLAPDMAVICAYEQLQRRNWCTWQYPQPADHPLYRRTANGHLCGDFWAKA